MRSLKFLFTCLLSFFTAFSNDSYRMQLVLYIDNIIRMYGSTFYIGIAMVILPYFGPLALSVSTPFDFYQHQSGEHVES